MCTCVAIKIKNRWTAMAIFGRGPEEEEATEIFAICANSLNWMMCQLPQLVDEVAKFRNVS